MRSTPAEQRLFDLIAPIAEQKGLRLVCVNIKGQEEGGQILQIMAENPQTRALGVDDCATLSREISAMMDVEDPIKGKYNLEVSSPGIDRPLVTLEDFDTFKSLKAKVEVMPPVQGQKKFRGIIKGVEDSKVILNTDLDELEIEFECIQKAKLVLTDDLLSKSKQFIKVQS